MRLYPRGMSEDWMEYLRWLADDRLDTARQVDSTLRAAAVSLALAELRGATDALVAAHLVDPIAANDYIVGLYRSTGQELEAAGLAEPVRASMSAHLNVAPGEPSVPMDGGSGPSAV